MEQSLRQLLEAMAEEEYRAFASKLIPNVRTMLGVRLPKLRKLAQRLAQGNWQAYLDTAAEDTFEEMMLQGMVIGAVQAPPSQIFPYVARFVPKIDNWSVCDSFCAGFKLPKTCPLECWDFLLPYFEDQREFPLRFAIVMLLFYYIDDSHFGQALALLDSVSHEGYYVKTAVAWAVASCHAFRPQETMDYLRRCRLDAFTYQKALSKIIESRVTDNENRALARAMRTQSPQPC